MQDDNPISLARRRAEKAVDGRLWTPLDCLHDTIEEIQSGDWKNVEQIFIAMAVRIDPVRLSYPYSCAGGRTMEYMGILSQHLHDLAAR